MDGAVDTVKTATVGIVGGQVTCLGILPDLISIFVGIATFIYLGIKIKKELDAKKTRKS